MIIGGPGWFRKGLRGLRHEGREFVQEAARESSRADKVWRATGQ
jgi:hypothetical protein